VSSTTALRQQAWPDERLVRECRKGSQEAWSALIEKYKNLIFSIPIKFGLSRDEAADVFQAVCMELLVGLAHLREPKALPKWLMQTAYHQCLRQKENRFDLVDNAETLEDDPRASDDLPEDLMRQVEREQIVREAIAALPARCNQMVVMLFFEDPPRSYESVAKQLRLATGSIGFVRGRCLKKLRQLLEEKGFK
jgi:RNA polymerase sigma factor (sigma-70 family)